MRLRPGCNLLFVGLRSQSHSGQEANWFAAFDLTTDMVMEDRIALLKCICRRWGFDETSVCQSFAGGGENSAFTLARFHMEQPMHTTDSYGRRGQSAPKGNPPESGNTRAWLKTWQALRLQGRRQPLGQVLAFFLSALNGTGTVERFFSKIQMTEVKGLDLGSMPLRSHEFALSKGLWLGSCNIFWPAARSQFVTCQSECVWSQFVPAVSGSLACHRCSLLPDRNVLPCPVRVDRCGLCRSSFEFEHYDSTDCLEHEVGLTR